MKRRKSTLQGMLMSWFILVSNHLGSLEDTFPLRDDQMDNVIPRWDLPARHAKLATSNVPSCCYLMEMSADPSGWIIGRYPGGWIDRWLTVSCVFLPHLRNLESNKVLQESQ